MQECRLAFGKLVGTRYAVKVARTVWNRGKTGGQMIVSYRDNYLLKVYLVRHVSL